MMVNRAIGRHQRRDGQGLDPSFPRLLGERLCLDFANTIEDRLGDHPEDFLGSYADLVAWGRHGGVLTETDTRRLLLEAESQPDEADAVYRRALALREAVYETFREVAIGQSPLAADLDRVREEYLGALSQARLVPADGGYAWTWEGREPGLDRVLWFVARSAVDLLTGDDLARVKQCPGADDCGWLFFDTSKNGTRRWCSMEGCGSRVKMRRHYARRRTADPAARPAES